MRCSCIGIYLTNRLAKSILLQLTVMKQVFADYRLEYFTQTTIKIRYLLTEVIES